MNNLGWFCYECGCLVYYESHLKYFKTILIDDKLRKERKNHHNHISSDRHCADCAALMLPFNIEGTFGNDPYKASRFFSTTKEKRLDLWKRINRRQEGVGK